MDQDENRAIGRLLREKRLEYGWGVETVAELYGKAIRGRSISGGAVFNMEEGTLPQGEKRRLVLARIFSIPPTALALGVLSENKGKIPSFPIKRNQSIDLSEYRATLRSYWMQGYQGSPESALRGLGQRIYALQDNAYYMRSPERDQMKRLLCGYLLRRSRVATELSFYTGALDHLNKAVILAQEENFADLEVVALYKRADFYLERRDFRRAVRDLKEAQSKMDSAPTAVRGTILHVRGLTDAYLAKTDVDLSRARRLIDASERYITPQLDQKKLSQGNSSPNSGSDEILVVCSEVSVQLDRAKALIAPANRKLHLSEEAYDISDAILQKSDPAQKRFHAYHALAHYIVLSQYYLDNGYYEMATTQTENALLQMEEMNSFVHLPTVVGLYEQLTASSYGKEVAVAELGLRLLFVQYPWIFA